MYPEPDILFVANDEPVEIRREGVFGPPDLVIEILSAGTAQNDRGPKFLAYIAIPDFWIDVRWLWPGEEKLILVRKAFEQFQQHNSSQNKE